MNGNLNADKIRQEIKDIELAYDHSETYEDQVYLDGKMDGLKIALSIIEGNGDESEIENDAEIF